LSTLIFFIGIQLLFGLQGPVDNSAHIGGLITGFALGIIAIYGIRTENTWKTVKRLSIIVIVSIALVGTALIKMPNKANEFRTVTQQFDMNDIAAQHYLQLLNESSDDEIVQEIKIQSLGFIKQNADILDQLDQMPIGQNGHYRVQLLRKYLLLQAKRASSEMFWIYYGRRTPNDKVQIEACDTELRRLTYELNNTGWTFQ
jgi:rhomboid protease GluP